MKIKNIENFTLEECREFLNMNPNNEERSAVEARMNAIFILMQNKNRKEQKEKQKRSRQEQFEKVVKWIDFKQFLSNHKYHKLTTITVILWLLILLAAIFAMIGDDFLGFSVIIILPIILILLIFIYFFNSPSLEEIYNIEQEEKAKSVRRTQDKEGKFGLHLCKKYKIVQLLPIIYDNIYYYKDNVYICVKGDKIGAYSTVMKKMVIDLEYDTIDIMQDGTLKATKNGTPTKFTTGGYRILD